MVLQQFYRSFTIVFRPRSFSTVRPNNLTYSGVLIRRACLIIRAVAVLAKFAETPPAILVEFDETPPAVLVDFDETPPAVLVDFEETPPAVLSVTCRIRRNTETVTCRIRRNTETATCRNRRFPAWGGILLEIEGFPPETRAPFRRPSNEHSNVSSYPLRPQTNPAKGHLTDDSLTSRQWLVTTDAQV